VGGMQNVSVQMIEAVKRRDDIELETIIMHSSWRFIGIKSFFFFLPFYGEFRWESGDSNPM
jgi:hypothetical protein